MNVSFDPYKTQYQLPFIKMSERTTITWHPLYQRMTVIFNGAGATIGSSVDVYEGMREICKVNDEWLPDDHWRQKAYFAFKEWEKSYAEDLLRG